MTGSAPVVSVGELAVLLNQTLEFAYPSVVVRGELSGLRVGRGAWAYFDLKDEVARVPFFGSVRALPGPLEDGMVLEVRGTPRFHPRWGFSVSVISIQVSGEGFIKKAAEMLKHKLAAEGLFDPERKRPLPYPPARVGLVTAAHSAAHRDFVKVLGERWGGIEVLHCDVQVQGEAAPQQIVAALSMFNQMPDPPEVLVVTRGGGSAEDLQAFSQEWVARAVAASRVPTLVAVGHETDISLAELTADRRASTPSNAAELLVPDRRAASNYLSSQRRQLADLAAQVIIRNRKELASRAAYMDENVRRVVHAAQANLSSAKQLLEAYNPSAAIKRGYALVRKGQKAVRSGHELSAGERIDVQMRDVRLQAEIISVTMEKYEK